MRENIMDRGCVTPYRFSRRARGCKLRIIRGKLAGKFFPQTHDAVLLEFPFVSKSPRLIGLNRPNTKYSPAEMVVRVILLFFRSMFFFPIYTYTYIIHIHICIYIIFEIPFLLYMHSFREIPDNP